VIERILPDPVVAVDTREELLEVELFPEEQAAIANSVEKRRREFVTARACARNALQRLGLPPRPILNGPRGEPSWPTGVVGSITHCSGYRACALARASAIATIGIDAETNAPLPDGVLAQIARVEERPQLADLRRSMSSVHWDRLLFSAKESVYKAWFPLAERWLGFEDAIVRVEKEGTFSAQLLVDGPLLDGKPLTGFSGRWLAYDGLLITAIARSAGPVPSVPQSTVDR
jgi:4'-phosphopantetheinyl transferase EntD